MKNVKRHIKAVIFDMDGTIIKSEHKWRKATEKAIDNFDHKIPEREKKQFLETLEGGGLYHAATKIKEFFKIEIHNSEIIKRIKMQAHHTLSDEIEFVCGFKSFQEKLSAHAIKHCVATNADKQSFEKLISKLELQKMFGKHLYCVDHVGGLAKPNPAIFLYAAKQLDVSPEECVVFEDSIFGFKAAKAAGMHCIAIINENNKKFLSMVDYAIEGYHQAQDALINILGIRDLSEKTLV